MTKQPAARREAASPTYQPGPVDLLRCGLHSGTRRCPRTARADQPQHRIRVEHDAHTLLIHLSGEEPRSLVSQRERINRKEPDVAGKKRPKSLSQTGTKAPAKPKRPKKTSRGK